MIIRSTFPLLRRRARQARRGLALLVEAEVVQLPLEGRELARAEELGQDRLQTLLRPRDDGLDPTGQPRELQLVAEGQRR